jgi:mRNA-degrading endonuclease toxin of MazEF toxin-antitoxin module
MKRTLPGEIWRVDFGLAAKVRPALILNDYPRDEELALPVKMRLSARTDQSHRQTKAHPDFPADGFAVFETPSGFR